MYDIQVMKVQKYTVDEIFEKGVRFLIPFHIFSHERRFKSWKALRLNMTRLKSA